MWEVPCGGPGLGAGMKTWGQHLLGLARGVSPPPVILWVGVCPASGSQPHAIACDSVLGLWGTTKPRVQRGKGALTILGVRSRHSWGEPEV